MARILELSSAGMDTYLYGDNSHQVASYLQSQIEALPRMANGIGERIVNSIRNSYQFVTDQMAKLHVRNELMANNLVLVDNYFSELTQFEQLQSANPTMQRWVMSHPTVRQYYLDQNLEGYTGQYENVFGDGVGDSDYNYRRVMDGVVTGDDQDRMVINHYYEELMPGDKELDWVDQRAILGTWDAIDMMLSVSNLDFTSTSKKPPKINTHKPQR